MYSSQFVFPYTASDTATLQRNMSSKRHMWCYACRTPPPGKPRRVLCCLSRKQLVLKDYILGFIPRRSTAYRLCPSTKVPLAPPGGPRERVATCPLGLWAEGWIKKCAAAPL